MSSWIKSNHIDGRYLARAIALMCNGRCPNSHRLAGFIESTAADCKKPVADLMEEIAGMDPIDDLITVSESDLCDWEKFRQAGLNRIRNI